MRDGGAQRVEIEAEHAHHLARVERQAMLVVPELEATIVVQHAQLAAFQDAAVLVSEQGQQDLVGQLVLQGFPVDVEEARVRR